MRFYRSLTGLLADNPELALEHGSGIKDNITAGLRGYKVEQFHCWGLDHTMGYEPGMPAIITDTNPTISCWESFDNAEDSPEAHIIISGQTIIGGAVYEDSATGCDFVTCYDSGWPALESPHARVMNRVERRYRVADGARLDSEADINEAIARLRDMGAQLADDGRDPQQAAAHVNAFTRYNWYAEIVGDLYAKSVVAKAAQDRMGGK